MTQFVARALASLDSIFALSLACLLVACSPEQLTSKAPGDLILEEQFTEVLVEMNLIEAVKSVKLTNITRDEKTKRTAQFYQDLWTKNGISEEQFKSSFEYYRSETETMARIYEEAARKIKRLEDLNNLEKQAEAGKRNQEKKPE